MTPTLQSEARRAGRPGPAFLVIAVLFVIAALFLPSPSRADVAAPGDVYFAVDVDQRFKYGPFANDFQVWADTTITGTSLLYTSTHDTTTTLGLIHISDGIHADAGLLELDVNSEMTIAARTGAFFETYNNHSLSLYIRGPSGTPYDISIATTGLLQASREGGLPGTLQPVNGTSVANFETDELWIQNGGTFETPIDHYEVASGVTTTQIVVDGETYSLAHARVFTSFGAIYQAICILGCMTEAADFHSMVDVHVAINVYPGGATGVEDLADGARRALTLAASPNPAHGATSISFAAPAGERAQVSVFDVSGRRVALLFDAPASAGTQSISWNASAQPAGVYFLRAESGRDARTTKVTLVK